MSFILPIYYRKWYYLTIVMLIIGVCFVQQSCQSEGKEKKYVIGFSQCISEDDWRKKMEADMYQELYFHDDLELILLDAKGDSEIQKRQIRQLIEQEVDVLIISALESSPLVEIVEEAYHKNIPIVLLDRKVNTEKFTTFIGANNYEIGYQVGDYVKTHFPNASVLEIWGLKDSSPAIERHRGFHDGIRNSSVTVSKEIQIPLENENFSLSKKPLLNNLKGVNVIFGHTDVITYNSYKTIQLIDTFQKINYMGIDGLFGENLGIDLVKKGILSATFMYPTGGKEAIKIAKKIIDGTPVNKYNTLISTVIDSSNLELIIFQENKISEQQSNIDLQHRMIDKQYQLSNKQRNIIISMVIVSLIILLLSVLLYRALQQKNKKNQELSELNKKISKQKLHIEQVSEQLKVVTAEKIRYFTNISHEFQTPLTLILTPLKEMIQSPNRRTSFNLNLIKKNAIRLQRLINQLMYFRKIEFNQLKMMVSEIDIKVFVKDLKIHFDQLAKNKMIQFQLENQLKTATIWGDKNLLDKVIFNLLSNAFKFTPEKGQILMELKEHSDTISIQIKNTGPRITPEMSALIFNRYYTNDYQSGVGIGLALSKEFVQLHKGKIYVDLEDKEYTSFVIELPKGTAHFPLETIYASKVIDIIREENDVFFEIEQPALQHISKEEEEELPHVLIIDDNKDLTSYFYHSLSGTFNIKTANNGKEGLKMAFDEIPDIIVCDIMMANVDGYDVLRKLKHDVKTSHIPVIMLTATHDENYKLKAFRKGADAYITKPFNIEFLIENIKGHLLNRKLLRQYYFQLFDMQEVKTENDIDLRFIKEFKEIVAQNIGNAEFVVEDIYTKLGLSRIQLYRKVKAILGCGVHDYIVNVRLEEAQKLLTNKRISIKNIAYQTGFTSPSYFSTVFKSKFNVTPSEYRKTL